MIKKVGTLLLLSIFGLIVEVHSKPMANGGLILDALFERIDQSLTDPEKSRINDSISLILREHLMDSDHYTPTSERIGKISSSDGKVNIFTWNYQINSLSYQYGGIIQFKSSKGNGWQLLELKDLSNKIPQTGFVRAKEWYGALYYGIVVSKYRKNTYYTLLGWDGSDGIIAKKIIDNFLIDNRGDIKFGYPIFRADGKIRSRVIFRFNARGSMMLAYDPTYKKIVFDHLSPDSPGHANQYQYYGPDFTYNGFIFKKGKWWLEKNIDVRNKDVK